MKTNFGKALFGMAALALAVVARPVLGAATTNAAPASAKVARATTTTNAPPASTTTNAPPVTNCVIGIVCPQNIFMTSSVPAAVFFNVTAGDSCGGTPSVTSSPPSGSTFPLGTTTVITTASDANGTNVCSFTITLMQPNCFIGIACPQNIVVAAGGPTNVFFNVTASDSCGGIPQVTSFPPSGSSFPVGTTTVNTTASDANGSSQCSFTVTVNPSTNTAPLVNEYFCQVSSLPPANTAYISPALWHAAFNSGIIIRNVRHHFFTKGYLLPPLGGSTNETFGSRLDFDLSVDGGETFNPATGSANVTVSVTHSQDANGFSFFDTQMTQLDLSGTNLPSGMVLRASTNLPSTGQTTVRSVSGGFLVSSFFDIFTDLSLDGGNTWTPASSSGHVEMRPDPTQQGVPVVGEPTPLLPPPVDCYVSPAQWHALFAQGIVLTNVSHKRFAGSLLPPPPGATNAESFDSVLDLQISTDGGKTFQFVRVSNVPVTVTVAGSSPNTNGLFDTQMTSLLANIPSGTSNIQVRASQSLASRGGTQITPQPDGTFQISSFFDIFPEVSLDGGETWSPATNGPVRMQLTPLAPEVPASGGALPLTNRPYVSPAQWHAAYNNGIYITNVTHRSFTQNYPPPAPGGTNVESFGSMVDGLILLPGTAGFTPFTAPAAVQVQVTSLSNLDNSGTRYFDTSMQQLNLSGGTLPTGVMVRASQSQASLGRTSVRTNSSGGDFISSYFDVFTEVSVDGGATWSPAPVPAAMAPATNASPASNCVISIACPANIVVTSSAPATVFYTVTASDSCGGVLQVTSSPPSGSVFPIGTTTVTSTATDANVTSQCSFTVTVVKPTCLITIACPANIVVTSAVPATVFYTVTASDSCGGIPSVTSSPPSGSVFPLGTTTVTSTATDANGTSQCSFTVTVVKPTCLITIACPANIVVTSGQPTPVFYTVTASDSCGGTPSVSSFPPSGSVFPPGTTTVTSTATDANGTSQCSFTVTVVKPTCLITVACPANIVVTSGQPTPVFYTVTASDSCGGTPSVSSFPPSGSVFPPGTTTVTSTATDANGSSQCSFTVTVKAPTNTVPLVNEYFCPVSSLPPINTAYISPALWHAAFNSGIIIRNVRHHFFTKGYLLPPLGGSTNETFGSRLDFDLSVDGGETFHPATGSANVTVSVTHSQDANGFSFFDTQMTQLDLSGTNLPSGMLLRASTNLPSTGQTTVRPVSGGFLVSSFFDIFTDLSLDGGNTWTPASSSGHVEMRPDPTQQGVPVVSEPTPLLPPPVDCYVSPAQWHALFAQGIVLTNVSHKRFAGSLLPPPPGATNAESFDSVLDLQISTDGGKTFQFVRVSNVPVTVTVAGSSPNTNGLFDTQMTSLLANIPSGTSNIQVRASQSLASRGGTQITPQPDGTFQISSFFDIFPEVSLDGGETWSPATNGPVRMQLTPLAPEVPASGGALPLTNRPYVSPAQWHAAYNSGIYITNVTHRSFTQNYPPPAPGGTNVESFGSMVDGLILLPGTAGFTPFTAPAAVQVQVTSLSNLDNGSTRYFDTSMQQLNLSGGTLPTGVMVRASQSQASLGRTSVRTNSPGGDFISSYFDVFTEVSVDGGATWSPAPVPAAMAPATNCVISIVCPPSITVTSVGPAVVTYSVTATDSCGHVLAVTTTPPSGSLFPVGSTTEVTSTASNADGANSCSFTVTVVDRPRVFPSGGKLPPTNSIYLSPAQWHAAYNNGIYISNVVHRAFTANFPPPKNGGSTNETFSSKVDFLYSTDGGRTFQKYTGTAACTVRVTDAGAKGAGEFYQTEMTQLDLSGGTMPAGMMLRVNTNQPSIGQTTITPTANGDFQISSFFDIFTDLSLDGGTFWMSSSSAGHMELHIDPSNPPTSLEQPALEGTHLDFSLPTQVGLLYTVEYNTDLATANWIVLSTVSGNGGTLTVNDPQAGGSPHRFYRVVISEDPNQ